VGQQSSLLYEPAAHSATMARHYQHAAHSRFAHGMHGYVANSHAGHRRYVWRNGRRYVCGYGYNPGAAVAAGVIGGIAAGYPYSCDDYYSGTYGGCDYGDYGDYLPY